MEHRGGCSADDDSGDGAGIMTQIPWKIMAAWGAKAGVADVAEGKAAVGMCFLPKEPAALAKAKALVAKVLQAEGLPLLGWRAVPVDKAVVGKYAAMTEPEIEQLVVGAAGLDSDELERKLYVARKLIESAAASDAALGGDALYFCSLSGRTIVYKGMLRSVVVGAFYHDLRDTAYESAFAIYHRRFSTNTVPKWPLAQPMRFLGHNGEINTLQGNLNWMASREADMQHPVWAGREAQLRPICNPAVSDSANLDRVAELLVKTGRSVPESMMLLVPEAYRNHPTLQREYPEVTAFYDYYSGQQEAWDGPALLVFSDGKTLGARLDRNGLRPARFWRTADGFVYVASEVGVLGDVLTNAANVVAKGRLGPGMMVTVNLATGEFKENSAIAREVASAHPYAAWNAAGVTRLEKQKPLDGALHDAEALMQLQTATGYSAEDVSMVIESMAAEGKEPTFCMGDDTPLPVLSVRPHQLYDYVKQRFAQVTNPAIDPLREGLVMSLEMKLGKKGNLLQPSAEAAKQVLIDSPVLLEPELEALAGMPGLKSATLPMRFRAGAGPGTLKKALAELCAAAEKAVRGGSQLLVLTDRLKGAPEPSSIAIPALIATGAVHHHLIASGLRTEASIVVDTASAFSTHHIACLVGYGASAVCPWLALESGRGWRTSSRTVALVQRGKMRDLSVADVQINYRKALNGGLKKILSKMGISLLSSYHGAQIFEVYGLGPDVIDVAMKGTVSRIGGLTLDELATEAESFWSSAFPNSKKLNRFGFFQAMPGLEYHGNNGDMSKLLHTAVGLGGNPADPAAYAAFEQHRDARPLTTLRDCLSIVSDRSPIPVDQVEPVTAIVQRFCTGGMSLGAISRETHEAIAIAMNRLGGKSNSGEGGEDPQRFVRLTDVNAAGESGTFPHLRKLANGDVASSAIKQVASGRFGVTPSFLMNADQVEIKIAQGAKPGEGGQLPGKKVSPYIATLRRSKAGVPLISPPPHHDIYSIEDLAQLIYDLHMINPNAKVSVKLVGQAGIGTVASGVAKANADIIQISGHDGGTGASPISSIKHAGGPVEMGLTESHKTLLTNGLRDRVVLRSDGGLRDGKDVVLAALMGADEYGFGTIAMIATGCIMARICHTNNCPVGVASQREELRARFPGAPGDLVNFFTFVAEEVRATMASMGYKSMDEIIGRCDMLKQKPAPLAKTAALDLSFLTTSVGKTDLSSTQRRKLGVKTLGPVLDDTILEDSAVTAAIASEGSVSKTIDIVNTDRSVCARVAGRIAAKYGDNGFAGSVALRFRGSAGQSFGAFVLAGLSVHLTGEANDYVGKGMAGGEIVIVPPPNSPFAAGEAILVGNTCLYGATGGALYVNGRAGERFAVRNSLAETVVEGTGDHCCEYMTGGCVVVLGPVGRNVAAGMTGGLGYFYDADGTFEEKVNGEIVTAQRVQTDAGAAQLRRLVEAHAEKTGSAVAKGLLADWKAALPRFWQLVPPSEANTPEAVREGGPAIPVKEVVA
jgi:glutamate synthase (ferredoxin)